MRTLGQALHQTFPENDTWSRHALAGLGTQVSMDMPICDLAAGRIWLTSESQENAVPTLLILTDDRLVFGQTTSGGGGLRWLPLDSVLNLDAIDAADGEVLHYELALTGGIGLAVRCPDTFVESLVAVLTGAPVPARAGDPQLADALTPVADDASALDRLGPPSLTERDVPDIRVRREPPAPEMPSHFHDGVQPDAQPIAAEPGFDASGHYHDRPAEPSTDAYVAPDAFVDPDPAVAADTVMASAAPTFDEDGGVSTAAESAPSNAYSSGGLPLRTPGAAFAGNPQTVPLQPMSAAAPVAADPAPASTWEHLDPTMTQEVPTVEHASSEWVPSPDAYRMDAGPMSMDAGPMSDETQILDAMPSHPEAHAANGTTAIEDEWWTEPSPADSLVWDEVSTTADGSREGVADGWLGHDVSGWEQWPEGAPNVAAPAGYSADEVNIGIDDFADLAVDFTQPGELADLDHGAAASSDNGHGLMYAVETNWWDAFAEWPEPFRSVTYLGGHPKHPKRRKNVTLHFNQMGVVAVTGGLANWGLEIPWSRVRSIDIEGSDELMFRSSLRIDLSSSALVLETDEGTVFFECRLRRPASVRTALATMTNAMTGR